MTKIINNNDTCEIEEESPDLSCIKQLIILPTTYMTRICI